MIVAFVGTIDEDDSPLPITGNGKTLGMTGLAYLDYLKGKEIWSNYYTDFSAKVIGFQEMINLIKQSVKDEQIKPNLVLLVTEMRKILDAIGSSKEEILFIDDFAEQIRKLECTLYWDTQRFKSINNRLRIHTNVIFLPYKTHMDNTPCYNPKCMKEHKIWIFSHKPQIESPRICFNSFKVGKHYKTKEFCEDKLLIPKRGKENGTTTGN
jgi:hypothetical protein